MLHTDDRARPVDKRYVVAREEGMVKTPERLIPWAALILLLLVVATERANAVELSGGVSLGWIQVGTVPHLAVGPRARMPWRINRSVLIAVDDLCSILPPLRAYRAGINNQTSVAVGHAWEDGDLSVGPSIMIYSMPACGVTLCGHIEGMAVGGHAQANVYVIGPFGLAASADVAWIGGRSLVLPGGVAAMIVAGPVVRWIDK